MSTYNITFTGHRHNSKNKAIIYIDLLKGK